MFGRLIGFVVLVVGGAGVAGAQDIPREAGSGFSTRQVWQGLEIDNEAQVQSCLRLSAGEFTLGFWGSHERSGMDDWSNEWPGRGRFRALDRTFEFAQDAWWLGIADHQFPGTGWERWQEACAGYTWEGLCGSPSICFAWGEKSGASATLELSGSFMAFGQSFAADFELTWSDARSNFFNFGDAGSGLTNPVFSIGTEIDAGQGWVMTPRLYASPLLNLRILEEEPRLTNVWVSLGFRYSF
jgi:hypothetical protein